MLIFLAIVGGTTLSILFAYALVRFLTYIRNCFRLISDYEKRRSDFVCSEGRNLTEIRSRLKVIEERLNHQSVGKKK